MDLLMWAIGVATGVVGKMAVDAFREHRMNRDAEFEALFGKFWRRR